MKNTKEKIIEASTEVFVEKGFSGASISTIAKLAGINQSLIYHHIGSKEDLWLFVKEHLASNYSYKKKEYEDLEDFINDIVNQRFELFIKEPRLVRMLQWQNLENPDLIGGLDVSLVHWSEIIDKFKEEGKIRGDYPVDMIFTYIYSLSTMYLIDNYKIFKDDAAKKKKYIKMITEEMVKTFSK